MGGATNIERIRLDRRQGVSVNVYATESKAPSPSGPGSAISALIEAGTPTARIRVYFNPLYTCFVTATLIRREVVYRTQAPMLFSPVLRSDLSDACHTLSE
jgi:hypothetical protein